MRALWVSFGFLGVELFAFGEGLFAEPGEAGDEGVERGKVRVGAAGVEQEARLEEALDGGLEGIVGVVGFGEEFVDGFLVLVVDGLVFCASKRRRKRLRAVLLVFKERPWGGGCWRTSTTRQAG